MSRSQRAFSLIETMVAVALVTGAVAGSILSMGAFGRFSTHQAGPVRSAAMLLAEQTLRVAQDAWKYGSPGMAPSGTWQTAVPLNIPGAGPTTAPVSVTTSISSAGAQGALVTVHVQYTPEGRHSSDSGQVSISAQAQVEAPVPGATVLDPSLVPQPSGAP